MVLATAPPKHSLRQIVCRLCQSPVLRWLCLPHCVGNILLMHHHHVETTLSSGLISSFNKSMPELLFSPKNGATHPVECLGNSRKTLLSLLVFCSATPERDNQFTLRRYAPRHQSGKRVWLRTMIKKLGVVACHTIITLLAFVYKWNIHLEYDCE